MYGVTLLPTLPVIKRLSVAATMRFFLIAERSDEKWREEAARCAGRCATTAALAIVMDASASIG